MPRIPIEGDIPAAPGAPGPGQGGPPAPVSGFGPRQRAKRLLRQAAGLQPPSDVQPKTGRAPAIEAALNLQLAEGVISKEQFAKATGGGDITRGASRPIPPGGIGVTQERDRRTAMRRSARRVRARRAGLLTGAEKAALGPLGATPGRLPSFTDFSLNPLRRERFF